MSLFGASWHPKENSNYNQNYINLEVVVHGYIPGCQEVEALRSEVQVHPRHYIEFEASLG